MVSGEPERTVEVTERGAQLMVDVIDMYIEGIADAQQATIEDSSLGDLETLLKVCGGYTETVTELNNIRRQLTG